jgi:hypothetical protein
MRSSRGDLVLVWYPDSNLQTKKRHPALVLQARAGRIGFEHCKYFHEQEEYAMTPTHGDDHPNNVSLVYVGRLLESDIRSMWWYGTLAVCRPLFVLIFGGFIIVFAMAGTAAVLLNERFRTLPFVTAVCVLLILIVAPLADYRLAIRRYRKRTAEYLETRVTLTPDRVSIENDAIRTEFGWKVIGLVVDTRQGMLFCNRRRLAVFWLPERVLTGERGRNEVRALLAQTKVRVLTF